MTVTAADSALREELGLDARRAWRAVQEIQLHGEGQNRLAHVCEQHDLAPSSVKALLRLSGSRPTAMRELAAAFACDASYITAVVDALEERGLARREPHPTDRRVRTVVLTDTGLQVAASVVELLSEPPRAIAVLSADEQRQLADLLDRVAAADEKLAERRSTG
ncbi:MAG TPA: MarR family transcriptional regulator [Frankiaceae bacterium]|nr:MarR family transcriptional regulator [Frankiaceae bacterium]